MSPLRDRVESGQYIHARPVFAESTASVQTVFTNPDLRVARIQRFAMHSFQVHDSVTNSHPFAVVDWVECHLSRYALGKPYEIWCNSAYVSDPRNSFVPLENVSCLLLC